MPQHEQTLKMLCQKTKIPHTKGYGISPQRKLINWLYSTVKNKGQRRAKTIPKLSREPWNRNFQNCLSSYYKEKSLVKKTKANEIKSKA